MLSLALVSEKKVAARAAKLAGSAWLNRVKAKKAARQVRPPPALLLSWLGA